MVARKTAAPKRLLAASCNNGFPPAKRGARRLASKGVGGKPGKGWLKIKYNRGKRGNNKDPPAKTRNDRAPAARTLQELLLATDTAIEQFLAEDGFLGETIEHPCKAKDGGLCSMVRAEKAFN